MKVYKTDFLTIRQKKSPEHARKIAADKLAEFNDMHFKYGRSVEETALALGLQITNY